MQANATETSTNRLAAYGGQAVGATAVGMPPPAGALGARGAALAGGRDCEGDGVGAAVSPTVTLNVPVAVFMHPASVEPSSNIS